MRWGEVEDVRTFVIGVASSVTASAVIYLALAATGTLSSLLRLAVMALLFVLGVIVAWLASADARAGHSQSTSVGNRIDATGSISVEQVEVKGSGETHVGTDLKSGGATRIRDIRIDRGEDSG